ncbi:MAG: hypothetical protein ACO3GO_05620 [Terrimicrobiaceae bacterium]
MKKLILLAAVLAAFSVSSAFAEGKCPGGGCGDKDKDDQKDSEKKSLTVQIDL